ncbi:putative ATP-dependent RNA helicase DHR1 [Rhizophlyctis rosea]|uniref:RNA helicase n=1 Tax=Rhizophlyctis rosea TaxID=64517 RepID=A0AAD5X4Y3_9FUNG|nr:putative ATP-dependent RNA helicase DHR1 [Rhizophlyctis rosea]
MGKRRPRYNEKARAASHLTSTAKPHPNARDGGRLALATVAKLDNQVETADGTPIAKSTSAENIHDTEYQASATANPLVLVPGQKGPAAVTQLLPEAPTGKMTSKKKKRLEKFIEKQLKKEERVKLLKKLSEQQFSSELLHSSKNLGRTKLTARERLRQALLEERSGVPSSNPDARLTVEVEAGGDDTGNWDVDMAAGMASTEGGEAAIETVHADGAGPTEQPPQSLIAMAFGTGKNDESASAPKAPIVVVDGQKSNGQEIVGLGAAPTTASVVPVVFGSALKRKLGEDGTSVEIPKRIKKKQKKKAVDMIREDRRGESGEDSDMDSGGLSGIDKNYDEEANKGNAKSMKEGWAADVISGETLPAPPPPKPITTETPPFKTPKYRSTTPTIHVPIPRPEHITLARLSLPIVREEQPIMEAILSHDITLLCGETGSGKTTQVPQFLIEAGFGDSRHPLFSGMIGVTQPRRVAAVSVAKRVGEEMGANASQVGYQVRYDKSTVGNGTKIKFMTDGILLRELSAGDVLLSKYSCIIIDEAHERTVGSDVLVGWLTRIVKVRNTGKVNGIGPLKVVIMSATLQVEDFLEGGLFQGGGEAMERPPLVSVGGRQHKVVVHYNKRTPQDYVTEAYKKVCKIHSKLPPGGILVFLTGQQEIQVLCKKLRDKFSKQRRRVEMEKDRMEAEGLESGKDSGRGMGLFEGEDEEGGEGAEEEVKVQMDGVDDFEVGEQEAMELEEDDEEDETHVLGGLSDNEDEGDDEGVFRKEEEDIPPLHVLPLYSLLPTQSQLRIFEPPPTGSRLCVVATNVAETSLTIPGIRYVVDTGKLKQRVYNAQTGVQTYTITWTSKASADQRAGRAGRTGTGHCYRLFSSSVFETYFEKAMRPEILRVPIEGVMLWMKGMGVNGVRGFPFVTKPSRSGLEAAEKLLTILGALEEDSGKGKITEMGKLMERFPVSPRYAKMIIVAAQQKQNILPYVIAIVAGMSVGDPFIRDEDIIQRTKKTTVDEDGGEMDDDADEELDEKARLRKKRGDYYRAMALFSGDPASSDAIRLLRAIGAYVAHMTSGTGRKDPHTFCEKHFLRLKAMEEVVKLVKQLVAIVRRCGPEFVGVKRMVKDAAAAGLEGRRRDGDGFLPKLMPPSMEQQALIRQVVLAGFVDRIAKIDREAGGGYKGKKAPPVYVTMWGGKGERCAIHPSSCLHSERPAPEWIVYEEVVGKEEREGIDGVVEEIEGQNGEKRIWLKGVTNIKPEWIAGVAPKSLCRVGKVMEAPEPRFNLEKDRVVGFVTPTLAPKNWELPVKEVEVEGKEGGWAWFARAVVEGVAFEGGVGRVKPKSREEDNVFKVLLPYVVTKPSTLIKSWGKTQTKVMNVLHALAKADISTRHNLVAQWQSNPSFLLQEYLPWVPADFHANLKKYWPPIEVVSSSTKGEGIAAQWRFKETLVKGLKEVMSKGATEKPAASANKWGGDVSDGDSDY